MKVCFGCLLNSIPLLIDGHWLARSLESGSKVSNLRLAQGYIFLVEAKHDREHLSRRVPEAVAQALALLATMKCASIYASMQYTLTY